MRKKETVATVEGNVPKDVGQKTILGIKSCRKTALSVTTLSLPCKLYFMFTIKVYGRKALLFSFSKY